MDESRDPQNQPSAGTGQRHLLKIPRRAWVITWVIILACTGAIIWGVRSRPVPHGVSNTFVGPAACAECHEEQAESWAETRMAKTLEVLRPGVKVAEKEMAGLDPDFDYTRDETCLPCHTTGWGMVGGFVSVEETPEMAGVTCEACHGPGGVYTETVMADHPTFSTSEARQAGLIYPPTARVCRKCHNEDSPFVGMDYKFDYQALLQEGTHAHFVLKYEHESDS